MIDQFPPARPPLPPMYAAPTDTREDDPLAWQKDARCAQTDPDLFFPEKGGSGARDAKKICGDCPVRDICLRWALEHGETLGVWGGMSPKQRTHLKNRSAA